MSMVVYRGRRTEDGVVVEVEESERPQSLQHRALHSAELNWGYGGGGPADLAQSILAHHLGGFVPSAGIYQAFKFKVVGELPEPEWTLSSEQVQTALDEVLADRGAVCPLCGDSGWLWREQTVEGEERACSCGRGREVAGEEGLLSLQ